MDITVDVVLGNSLNDPFGALDVDVLEGEVLGWIVSANKVVDDVGVSDTGFDGGGVAEVILLFNL